MEVQSDIQRLKRFLWTVLFWKNLIFNILCMFYSSAIIILINIQLIDQLYLICAKEGSYVQKHLLNRL